MSDRAEDLVLAELREIGTKLNTLDQRFDTQEKRWNETQNFLSQALGMGLINQKKNDEQDSRITELETRARKIEELHTDLRKWVTQIDERT